jgi:hypothetical protein
MANATCYQPVISRALIAALFHEAKRRRLPMTRLVDVSSANAFTAHRDGRQRLMSGPS